MRFALTFVLITGIVLLFLNIYCFKFSRQLFYESKQNATVEKAQLAADEIGRLDLLSSSAISSTIDKMSNLSYDRLLVTDTSGLIIYDSLGDFAEQPKYSTIFHVSTALQGNRVFTCNYSDGRMCSEAAIPIISFSAISGCVYIMELDTQLGSLLDMLQTGIFTVTVLLELGLLLISILYTYRFSRRMRKIMASMDIIQEGDYTHKVRMGGHDELTILGEEFNDLTERLQISESKRRQFVSDASHELKTPLASIKLLSDSILHYDMDMETIKEFVGDIGNEADRLTRMTSKLLALTKGESSEIEPEIIYMAPTLRRVTKMLSALAQENGVVIEMDLYQDSQVLILEDDLYQIAFNLAENGIKYNVPNGTLRISLHQQEDNAILRVSDTGMGIPPEAISHVFERFYRVDKARSRQSGGSGLGLAIVRSIVERNNGQIHLQSTLGKGTTFTVEFPRFDIDDEEDD